MSSETPERPSPPDEDQDGSTTDELGPDSDSQDELGPDMPSEDN